MSVNDTPLNDAKTVIVTNNKITRFQYGKTYFNNLAYVFMIKTGFRWKRPLRFCADVYLSLPVR